VDRIFDFSIDLCYCIALALQCAASSLPYLRVVVDDVEFHKSYFSVQVLRPRQRAFLYS